MILPKSHTSQFVKFLRTIGASVSGPRAKEPAYIVVLGDDVVSIREHVATVEVTCTNAQRLSDIQGQWAAIVQALTQKSNAQDTEKSNESGDNE